MHCSWLNHKGTHPVANSILTLLALKGFRPIHLQQIVSTQAHFDIKTLESNLNECVGELESCDNDQQAQCYNECLGLLNENKNKPVQQIKCTAMMQTCQLCST